MSKKRKLLEAIKTNTFVLALNGFNTAMSNINNIETKWNHIHARSIKSNSKNRLEKEEEISRYAARGSVIDALSVLAYLYNHKRLTKEAKSIVESQFEFCMANEDLREPIENACRKSKYCTLNKLYKKYKKKVKAS